jgi:cytochrome c553
MDLRGKTGIILKETTIITNLGTIILSTKVSVGSTNSPSGPGRARSTEERAANLRLAAKNRQAVFQNDCVECHVKPTIGKRGKQLYATACGICHDAKNRAPFVTELRALTKGKDKTYWNTWIADSKPGSLMPAFAKKHGGVLDDSQIKSLVAYLTRIFPRELKTKKAVQAATNNKALPIK